MTDFEIIPMITNNDMDEKGYVHWKTWHETYTNLMPSDYLEKMSLEKCVSLAHRWPDNTLVLKDNGKVIGFSCYSQVANGESEEIGEVIAIYLLKQYQGKKLGYTLLNETIAKLSNKRKIVLWVLDGNEKAISFYKKYGFKFDGHEKKQSVGVELRMVLERQ